MDQILIWAIVVVAVLLFGGFTGLILFFWNEYQINQQGYVGASLSEPIRCNAQHPGVALAGEQQPGVGAGLSDMDPDRLQILIWAIVVTVFLFSGIIGFILFVWNQYQIDQHYVAAVALALKEFTARMDTINPPTRVEHDRLINEVAVINQGQIDMMVRHRALEIELRDGLNRHG
jgi:uncharacterized membrane protein